MEYLNILLGFVEWAKKNLKKFLWFIFLLSALCRFGSIELLRWLWLEQLSNQKWIIGPALWGSFILLFLIYCEIVYKFMMRYISKCRQQKEQENAALEEAKNAGLARVQEQESRNKIMCELSHDEKNIVASVYINRARVVDLQTDNKFVSSLMKKDVLKLSNSTSYHYTEGYTDPCELTDWALKYIEKHPEFLRN